MAQPQLKHSTPIPPEFLCPISCDIMEDPVVDKDGISYEKEEILHWLNLKPNQTSPMNPKRKMTANELVPNRALRSQIEAFKLANPNYHLAPVVAPVQASQPVQPIMSDIVVQTSVTLVPLLGALTSELIPMVPNNLVITMKATSQPKRLPVHILCVVDVSGSMNTEVEIVNSSGVKESNGLSRLDIVKHALYTIVQTMTDADSVTLITFSNSATVIASKQKMTTANKATMTAKIKALKTEGQTNIWDGLKSALNVISTSQHTGESNAVFLLTDGEPNIEPPRGHEAMLTRSLQSLGPKCVVNTFGFSYGLNSQLLNNLGSIGSGFYSFIPDAGFIGTIFINALSNLFLTYAIQSKAVVTFADNTTEQVLIGSARYEMVRTVAVNIGNKQVKSVSVSFVNPNTLEVWETVYDNIVLQNDSANLDDLVRQKFVKVLQQSLVSKNATELKTFIAQTEQINPKSNLIKGILADAKGQVMEALSSFTYFEKWGKHYLPSLAMAHSQQLCNNFKDPGVQTYATAMFEEERNKIDDIFGTIPPPTPSIIATQPVFGLGNNGNNHNYVPTTSMRSYNTVDNGCFAGECTVVVLDKNYINGVRGYSKILVKDVKVGDIVKFYDSNGYIALTKVTHVMKTILTKSIEMIQYNNGLLLTKWHPIVTQLLNQRLRFSKTEWHFPESDLKTSPTTCKLVMYDGEAMYDFVLKDKGFLPVNGVSCATLGHNFIGDVVGHPYFGSSKVIEDLDRLNGNSYVTITQDYFRRDPNTKLINGIKMPVLLKWKDLAGKIKIVNGKNNNKRTNQNDNHSNIILTKKQRV